MPKLIDLTNKIFNRLKVISRDETKTGRYVYWICECDCGNTCETYVTDLTSKVKQSCNCLEYENQIKGIEKVRELITENTNVGKIKSTKPYSNTTSGIRGVSWCTSKQKWIATIRFQGHIYYLGSSSDKKWCETLRKEAEEKIYGEFLEWYNKR